MTRPEREHPLVLRLLRTVAGMLATLGSVTYIAFLSPDTLAAEPEAAPAQADHAIPTVDPAPLIGGRLAWLSADSLDLVGDLYGDVPFLVRGRHEAWFDFDLRTAIEETGSNLSFVVRDIEYRADLGWRMQLPGKGPGVVSVFAGQRGRERVDADGGARVRFVAAGLESRRFRQPVAWRPGADVQWRIAAGPVLHESGVDADAYLLAAARARWAFGDPERPLRAIVFDLKVDGLFGDDGLDADVTFGPGIELPVDAGRRALFFVHYQNSENPLGIGEDSWLVGLEYAEGPSSERPSRESRSRRGEISGTTAAGVGEDGRVSGQVALRMLSPEFGRRLRVILDADANVLTSDDADDLYWRYEIGLERVKRRTAVGLYLYHRSNHVLSQPASGFTSRNVVELGWETDTWKLAGKRPTRNGGRFDFRFRIGYLANSTFGEDRRVNLRAGIRWAIPFPGFGRTVPYFLYDFESGDIRDSTFAMGLALSRRLDVQFEYRDDDQYFASDRSLGLITARYGF